MSDVDEPQAEASLATSRSRRERGRKKASRLQELDNLKASRIHGKRQLDQVEEIDNVYDVVDVDEYSELVSKRQNDDWIVDDDGGYVEDGREIFDEEMGDEVQGHRSSTGSKRNPTDKGNQKSRRKADANATTEEGSSSSAGKSIKNMILNMGGGSKKSLKKEANLQDDLVLGELLGEFKSSSSSKPQDKKGTKIKAKIGGGHSNPFATQVVRPSSTGIKREA
eukprot:00978.XXX_2419_3237_1 [CDS] Oithona nana genome sequencing.